METNMEAKSGALGGEVRRIHIIYFLSRTGRIEHPHLIRVHHLNRNGVHLRDVKRWLSDLRGKDMPNSFAWSYKRKYKTGYVWQDLLDDDLITPISDNEYVLKGSEIHSIPFDPISCGSKKVSPQQPEPLQDKNHEAPKGEATQQNRDTQMDISTKALSEIDEESGPLDSETSTTLTDESIKLEDEKHSRNGTVEEIHEQQSETVETTTFNPGSEMLKNNDDNKGTNLTEKTKNPPSDATNNATPNATDSPFTKSSKSHHSSGASHVFRNLLTCGAVDTNDSAMVRINRVNKNSNGVSSNKSGNTADQICKTDTKCQHQSARKSFSGMKNSKKNEVTNQRKVSAPYKPVSGPNCSQCGKEFRPEKMHAHMKSCRGLKAMAKNSSAPTASTAEKATTRRSTESASKEGTPGYFLTH